MLVGKYFYTHDSHLLDFDIDDVDLLRHWNIENAKFESFCEKNGIKKEFSAPKTQQNRVVERKNRVMQEMARVMLLNKQILQKFWGEVMNTSCHIGNRIFFQTKKTAYEIWNGKNPKVKYFWVFGSKCYILND